MSYFEILEYDNLNDEKSKVIYEEISAELGFGIVPNLFKSMAVRPDFLEANWHKFRSVILEGEVPRTLKEMIGVAISQANQSEYALKVHLHGLSVLGISEEVLRTLATDFENCPLPSREKAVIRFGLQAATNPRDLSTQDYQNLQSCGLDSTEIFEIIATANLFTQINQYTDAIGLEIDAL
ncbi:carboxymuconolactone decarboxylase family protein [Pseudanabaena sp. FACHB-2040]|uniref:carboxymuconolactone decarboxylase family protein n=1 Tax=Pseudanabaena sp. FACHB-2040 TaxID=2692859 RepID=UPI001684765D|nr:carboxymuconolactone decarboxylase family protein [Pseudanabaena sp. FACHB-2040]MBD2256058.1 carboxymuconolactone decarboxylase family protein [Pseudanabaena sp. FACHB-2040]